MPLIKRLVAEDWSSELYESPLSDKTIEKPIKYISLIESLQNFKISPEALQPILSHMTSSISMNMIAKIAAINCEGI